MDSISGKQSGSWNPFRKNKLNSMHVSGEERTYQVGEDQPSLVGPLVQIDCRDATEEADEWRDKGDDLIIHGDTYQVELILPHVLFREEAEKHDRWHHLFLSYKINYDDDQWAAAKRGDLEALKAFTGIDWTEEDDFESTPLYYGCHSGAARDIMVVKYLLDVWPGQVAPEIAERCKKNAINARVVRLLENTNDASILTPVAESDDFFYENSCVGGWNIFEEEECDDY